MPDNYYATALQVTCHAVNRLQKPEARQSMMNTIDRIGKRIRAGKGFIGADTRLFVLPEYFLTSFPLQESIEEWTDKAAIDVDGPEYEAMGKICQDNDVYLAGNTYETDEHFPGIFFQTSFIIAPSGDVVLRYRRLVSMFSPTPHDVWDRYLDIYGIDKVFPVADTDIGRLAAVASEEIVYPEITRAHVLRGAEVIVHSSSEVASPGLTPKDLAKRSRAVENLVYVVSANSARIEGTDLPDASVDGMSKIVDFHGEVLAEASTGETMAANAEIDLAALRRYRRRPGMFNILSRQRTELFRDCYGKQSVYPANTLLQEDGKHHVPDKSHFIKTQSEVIKKLSDTGII